MSAVDKAKNDAPSASAPPVLKPTRPATPPPPPARAGAASVPSKPLPDIRPNGLGLAPAGPPATPPRLDAPPPSPPPTSCRDPLRRHPTLHAQTSSTPSSGTRTRASPPSRRQRHHPTRARRTTPSASRIRTCPQPSPASLNRGRDSTTPSSSRKDVPAPTDSQDAVRPDGT